MPKRIVRGIVAAGLIAAPVHAQSWSSGAIARGVDHAIVRFAQADPKAPKPATTAAPGDAKAGDTARPHGHPPRSKAKDKRGAKPSSRPGTTRSLSRASYFE